MTAPEGFASAALTRWGAPAHLRLRAASTSTPSAAALPGSDEAPLPLRLVTEAGFEAAAADLPAPSRRWLQTLRFRGAPDTHVVLPDAEGRPMAVWAGVREGDPYALAALPKALPPLVLRLDARTPPELRHAHHAAFGWALGGYRFDRYKRSARPLAILELNDDADARAGLVEAEAATLVRDLVTTPAEGMGPADLSRAVRELALRHDGAQVQEIVGDALLAQNYPAVHAVGRAAHPSRAPRMIELTWGDAAHPVLALVGKGVCFDTGGLDIKTGEGMRWMKKDMGGAANAMALAHVVMARKLPVRLVLLIPAVENAIDGGAMRPGDVYPTRKGLAIEIGNTDAEGRVILCDALARAGELSPELIVDMATLTGAARIALGADLPALFSRDTALARDVMDTGLAQRDPMWHMPLWDGYHPMIESDIADIVNTGKGPKGGAVTAALFLADFVAPKQPWLHIDLYAWNDSNRPGRPVGGEMQTVRALAAWLGRRYGVAGA